MNRNELFERTHAVVVRLEIQPGGKAQAIGQSHSKGKPGSVIPDMAVLADRHEIEAPLWRWLNRMTPQGGGLMERFHVAIIQSSEREADNLIDILGETERRLAIKWADGRHEATPSEPADKQRDRVQRRIFFEYFDVGTAAVARDEGKSEDWVRHQRRSHGIDGHGKREEPCPTAVLQLSIHSHCATCQIVDDLMAGESRTQMEAA